MNTSTDTRLALLNKTAKDAIDLAADAASAGDFTIAHACGQLIADATYSICHLHAMTEEAAERRVAASARWLSEIEEVAHRAGLI